MLVLSYGLHAQSIDLTASSTTATCGPFTVQFSPDVAFPVDSFFWDFGDGGTSTDSSPVHIYTDPGTYHVSLEVVESGNQLHYDTTKANFISLGGVLITKNYSTFPSCYGIADGEISLNVLTGVRPFTYAWYQQDTMTGTYSVLSFTDSVISGLSAGIYRVEVTDAGGCMNDRVFDLLTAAPKEMVTIFGVTDESCSPGNDGKAWVEQVIGGTAPYDYTWSQGSQNDTIDSLESGYHSITITDWNGCTASENVFVDSMRLEPDPQIDITDPVCNGDANGKAWIVDDATTYPFAHTISWSNGSVGDTATNLGGGNYIVTITETATGCSATRSLSLNDPPVLGIDVLQTFDPICWLPGNCVMGAIFVEPTGGVLPYYNSSGSLMTATDNSKTNLSTGTFGFYVEDANGCMESTAVTLPRTGQNITYGFVTSNRTSVCGPLTVDFHAYAINVPGNSYWFTFSDGDTAYGASVSHTFTQPGVYDFTYHSVADPGVYKDTTIYGTIQILEPSVNIVSQQDATCGNSDGYIDIEVINVSPDYTVTWSRWDYFMFAWVVVNTGFTTNSEDLMNVPAGTYQLDIQDDLGCSYQNTFTINDRGLMSLSVDETQPTCNGGTDGSCKVNVSGGVEPFNYIWSTGEVTQTISGLAAGNYSVTVIDSSGCDTYMNFYLGEPDPLNVVMDKTDATCSPGGDGMAWVVATGGVPQYSYAWSAGTPSFTGDTIAGLGAGDYYVTVTDDNGCVKVDSVTIQATGGGGPVAAVNFTVDVNCFGGNDGAADITITGGVLPYTYVLSGSGMPTTVTNNAPFAITDLVVGTYTLDVTDAMGCTNSVMFTITEPQQITTTMSKVDASCTPGFDGEASVLVGGGASPYTFNWDNRPMSAFDTIMGLNAGMIHLEVVDVNGCFVTDSIMINSTGTGQLDMDSSDISCFGAGDGKAWVTDAATLYPTFTNYQWSNSSSSDTLYTSVPGTFFVTLTDGSGTCSMIDSVTINEPDSLYVVIDQLVDASCSTCNDGEAYLTVYGGVGPTYAHVWSNFNTTLDQVGLLPGNYDIISTDNTGCNVVTTLSIGYGHLCVPTLELGNDTVVCDPIFTIDHNLSTSTIHTFMWGTGETTSTVTVNTTDTYHLYTTDTFGCQDHDSIQVSFVVPAITNAGGDTLICDGGAAQLTATGGATYDWSPVTGLSDPTIADPIAGPNAPETYQVTITDANGCISTYDIEVDVDTSCVWPGDANLDGIANNDDVLTIGLFYGQSGLARPNASVVWEAQPLPSDLSLYPNWPLMKHADCNGDATIDNLDTNAITVNYGLTHLKTEGEGRMFVDPLLYFVLPDSTPAGQVADIDVMLGENTLPANNAYGIIFSINYDNTIVADTPFVLNTSGSWLGTSGADLLAYKHNLYSNSRIDVALSRTDGVVRSGFGKLGTVSMTMKDDISGKDYLAVDMDLSFSNIKLIDNQGNIIPIVSEDGVLRVYDPSTSINDPVLMSNMLRVYPNPSTGDIYIEIPGAVIDEVRMLDVLGQEMLNMYAGSNLIKLDLADFSVGTYFVQVKVNGQWLNKKVILTDQ